MSKKKKPVKKSSAAKKGDWKKRQPDPTPLEAAAEAREEAAIEEAALEENEVNEEELLASAEEISEEESSEAESLIENSELNLEFAEDESADEEERVATDEEVEGSNDELANTELGSFESANIEDVEVISEEQIRSVVESVLFTTDKPISIALIKQVFKGTQVKSKDIREALTALMKEYDSTSRGFTLQEIAGGFQLRTKSENNKYLRQTVKARPFKLSGPALEVLSIVAYKQPCTKAQIDEIRGVESGHLLRALMEKHLLNFGERSELPGKPMFYETTRKFLEIFGLRNIAELPSLHEIDQLIPEGIGDDEPKKEKLSDLTGELSTQVTDASYSVGEDELLKITDELTQITTSSDFFEQEKQRMREKRDADRAQDIRERQIVGEEIDSKDLRWLERYEAAKAEGAAQAEDVEFVTEGMDSENIPTSTDEAPAEEADAEMSAEGEELSEESSEMIADALEDLEPTEREPEQEA
jgi:segregation and condensation protein B